MLILKKLICILRRINLNNHKFSEIYSNIHVLKIVVMNLIKLTLVNST